MNLSEDELRIRRMQEMLPGIERYIEELYIGNGSEEKVLVKKRFAARKKWGKKNKDTFLLPQIKECIPLIKEPEYPSKEKTGFSISYSPLPKRRLEDVLAEAKETFSQALLRLISRKNLRDSDVYNRAGISRQLFSKIRKDKDYQPTKKTVLALAVAMKLNIDEVKDLLNRAGLSLSPSKKEDLVVQYFLEKEEYDIFLINDVLEHFKLPTLF